MITLGIGIGALSSIVSAVDAVLLRNAAVAALGFVALLLAAVGLYSVRAYDTRP